VFLFCHWPRTKPATLIILIGGLIAVLPFAINSAYEWYIRGKPIDAVVDNEQHVTITGWASKDYSYLANKVNAVVVQMANPDVTDETLQFLRAMTKLRELDVSSTQVSDEGLKLLADLPALQDLRLMNTKITDEGFQSHLAAKDSLLRLDLRGTKVATKTLREWKTKREGREYLK
jgi:hypothetical protein